MSFSTYITFETVVVCLPGSEFALMRKKSAWNQVLMIERFRPATALGVD